MPSIDSRVAELLQWVHDTGQALPMPVAAILSLEGAGLVVNLDTGEVVGQNWADSLLAELCREVGNE